MLGLLSKCSSFEFNADSCIFVFTKKSFTTVLGLEMSFAVVGSPSSKRWVLVAPSMIDLLFGRSGFIFVQNSPGNECSR